MFYPDDFKKRVKKAYPDLELLHKKLDEGDDFIFIYLRTGHCMPCAVELSPGALSVYTVLEFSSLDDVKKRSEDEKEAIFALDSEFETDTEKEFNRRYTAISRFYPDKKQAKEILLAPLAFSYLDIMNVKSFDELHEEAVLRRERMDIIDECQNLYNSQNS